MPVINPLPIEIVIPKIPSHLPPESQPRWTEVEPETQALPDIPVEIEFPVYPTKTVQLPLKINVQGVIFEVNIALSNVEGAPLRA